MDVCWGFCRILQVKTKSSSRTKVNSSLLSQLHFYLQPLLWCLKWLLCALLLTQVSQSSFIFVHSARLCQAQPCSSSPCQPQHYQPLCALGQQQWSQWQACALQHPAATAVGSTAIPTSRGPTTFPPTRAQAATEERTTSASWEPRCCAAILKQSYCAVLPQPVTPRSAAGPVHSPIILRGRLETNGLGVNKSEID